MMAKFVLGKIFVKWKNIISSFSIQMFVYKFLFVSHDTKKLMLFLFIINIVSRNK